MSLFQSPRGLPHLIAAIVIVAMQYSIAGAVPLFEATALVQSGATNQAPVEAIDSSPVSASATHPPNTQGFAGTATAFAGRGEIRTTAQATTAGALPSPFINSLGEGHFVIPITIGGPPGASGTGSLRLSLNGVFNAPLGGISDVAIFGGGPGQLADFFFGNAKLNCINGTTCFSPSLGFPLSDGILTGYTGGPVVLTVPLGREITPGTYDLSVRFGGSAQAGVNLALAGTGFSDFGSTLSFATSGPVFLLPEGFTADSPEGGIFNNLFVGDGAQTPTPEPATILLLGTTAAGLALHRWRQRGTKQPATDD